jgi:hypothetical protein
MEMASIVEIEKARKRAEVAKLSFMFELLKKKKVVRSTYQNFSPQRGRLFVMSCL